MKKLNFLKQEGRTVSSRFLKMFTLLALLLVGVNGAWGQKPTTPGATSDIYKFKGSIATREYTPLMPYRTNLHEQSTNENSIVKLEMPQGSTKTLFEVGTGKGFKSAGTFEDNREIVDFPNFAICATGVNGGIIHYRLTFYYSGGSKSLDIYRHIEDKKDGLAVIALQTPALFSQDATGRNEISTIYKVDIQCFNYDNRHFQIESCYFIEAMPDFNFNDIDGRYIGNAYLHPSYLIPSAGTIIYPNGEESGNPDYDDYIVEVKTTTNFTDNETGKIDWRVENEKDSTARYNPTLVWSMKYSGFNGTAPYEDMSKVTYTTVDRWGGDAFWRWIFQKRVLAAKDVAPEAGVTVPIADYKLWNSLYTGATEVTAKNCAYNFNQNTNLAYGNTTTHTQYVDLTQAPYNGYTHLIAKINNGNVPTARFTTNTGAMNEANRVMTQNGDYYSVALDGLKWLHAVYGNDINLSALYLAKADNVNNNAEVKNVGVDDVNYKKYSSYQANPTEATDIPDNDFINTVNAGGGDYYHGYKLENGNAVGYGDISNVLGCYYVILDDYDELRVKVTSGTPEFRFNRQGIDGSLLSFDGNNTNYCTKSDNTYTVNLKKIKAEQGYVHLNCIKGNIVIAYDGVRFVQLPDIYQLEANDFNLHKESGTTATTPGANWAPVYGVVSSYHNPDYYTDLAGKECLEITTTSQNPRFVFNDGTDKRVEVKYDDPGQNYITKDGDKYSVNLDRINTEKGMVHLNGIFLQDANGSYTCTAVVTKSNSVQVNYDLTDTDMQHYYNSVYNGDFTNWINDGAVTPNTVNYMYYQLKGNEYKQTIFDKWDEHADRTIPTATCQHGSNSPLKQVYGENSEVIGYYNNVCEDGCLVSAPTNILMHIKDVCITKNKVEARQNHIDLGGEGVENKSKLQTADSDNYYWQGFWQDSHSGAYFGHYNPNMGIYADITDYHTMIFKGEPNTEIELFFNSGTDNAVSRRIKLDDNTSEDDTNRGTSANYIPSGYATLDLSDPELKDTDGHIYLCSIKTIWGQTVGKLEYVRLVKDKDDLMAKELTVDMFHTWNNDINATVTRLKANGNATVCDFGSSKNPNETWYGIDNYRAKAFNSYAELTGYKWIKVTGTQGAKVRFIANAVQKDGDIFVEDFVTLNETDAVGNGVGYLDISGHQYYHLNVICNANDGATATVNKVELLPDPRVDYVLEGNGVLGVSAAKALMDRAACVIDVRPRVNNNEVLDLADERIYIGNADVWPIAAQHWPGRFAKMFNQNCIVIMRGKFDGSVTSLNYNQLQTAQYWHGFRSMHHANTALIPADRYSNTDKKHSTDQLENNTVLTSGLYLIDSYPYRIPMDLKVTSGNSACYARYIPTAKAVVNTICVPFEVNGVSASGDNNLTTADAGGSRVALNGEQSMSHFYKITDLVHNIGPDKPESGLLEQDYVKTNEYVFCFRQVDALAPYTPYVFVNRHDNHKGGTLREGKRIEVYSPQGTNVDKTVDAEGKVCQGMDNSAHKTDLNDPKDEYYLYATNATKHTRDCWFFNSEGYLVKSHYLSTPSFRAVMKNLNRTIDMPFEDQAGAKIKVVSFDDWMNSEEDVVAIKVPIAEAEEEMVPVYSVSGILLRPAVKLSNALEGLPKGIYIVGDKKAIKR
ncbi:MAG: hypothetical protein KBT29_02395 [Prevotellaceae bacterium]|nr:hypothetical protein [Candidatus Minthosoma caballi]